MRDLIVLVLVFVCSGCAAVRTPSTQDLRAVAAAETFVLANGYTAEPPSLPFEQLTPELWDGLMSQSKVLTYRHNYLESRAIGFVRNKDGWLVVFKVTEHAVSSGQDIFPFSPVGRYAPVTKQLQVGALMHAWADPNDPDMIRIAVSK